jgi:hypothetical protein
MVEELLQGVESSFESRFEFWAGMFSDSSLTSGQLGWHAQSGAHLLHGSA